MGMISWRIMPLLSTLAALVILVHTAEEDMERHQLGLRSRGVDTQDNDYDQAWRTLTNEPVVPKSDEWNGPSSPQEDPPRRRKPWRKRKRRPMMQEAPRDDDRRHYHDEPESRPKADYPVITEDQGSSEPLQKRKKRPEMQTWAKEERPMRRRGQRRKRPNFKNFTLQQESEHRPLDFAVYSDANDDETRQYTHRAHLDEAEHAQNNNQPRNQSDIVELSFSELQSTETEELPKDTILTRDQEVDRLNSQTHDVSVPGSIQEDSSIMKVNNAEESGGILTPEELEEARNPGDLKELLKKSNGGSLSEILQHHNLSLTDLLQGDKRVLKILNTAEKPQTERKKPQRKYKHNEKEMLSNSYENFSTTMKTEEKGTESIAIEITYIYNTTEPSSVSKQSYPQNNTDLINKYENLNKELETQSELLDTKEDAPKIMRKRPLFNKGRRKLRLRMSDVNNTQKISANKKRQLEHDVEDLNDTNTINETVNINISHHNKTLEKKYIKPTAYEEISKNDDNNIEKLSLTINPLTTTVEVTTIPVVIEDEETNDIPTTTTADIETIDSDEAFRDPEISIIEETFSTSTTERAIVTTTMKTAKLNNSELRRQALTNRLKRKRLKQKQSTTEYPDNDAAKDLFGMTNLVSASEFIAKTQNPRTTMHDDYEAPLTDFFATESSNKVERSRKLTPQFSVSSTIISKSPTTTTEKTAKIEIAEILNDYDTSARLSKVLMERNMTISELVEHRERGSSNVHLADIFHNTSREPNPPEPFLSKSSIEPISKGTYPLRALLEANQHEAATKPTIEESSYKTHETEMPIVVMDYGHNVNENAENLGIMSLFDNITTNHIEHNDDIKTDSDGTPYVTSITSENITNNDNTRSGRDLDHRTTVAGGLTELFVYMQRKFNDGNKEITETLTRQQDPTATDSTLPATTEDEERLMVLEDLQHLKEFNSNIASASDEDIEVKMVENQETTTDRPGLLNKIPSGTKSVTVATASILGLTTVVFLMTYIMIKWKQQRNLIRKKESFSEERIPTPVFESRKGNKIQNSIRSTRSVSPMLSTSNIYTLNTLDSRNGAESPEYMWDSLRKPFQ